MSVLEIIEKRYSCRDYQDKPVEQTKLDKLMEAARQAPSAKNLQDWRFVVVTDRKIKQQVAATTNKVDVFSKASVIIVACSNSDYVMKCGQAVGPIDVSIALEHIALAATELGLGTCWIGAFDTEVVRQILQIPQGVNIVELMTVGYPADTGRITERVEIEEIVCYDKWRF